MGVAIMARKATGAAGKAKGKPDDGPRAIGFRVSAEYAAWLDKLAEANRSTVAGLIDQALADRARAIGFNEAAPRRVD
jgi:hypothetical protein